MSKHDNDLELKIKGMMFDDLDNKLSEKCYQVGRMTAMLTHVRAELFFYQKRYGRIDVWNEVFEARKRLELN